MLCVFANLTSDVSRNMLNMVTLVVPALVQVLETLILKYLQKSKAKHGQDMNLLFPRHYESY